MERKDRALYAGKAQAGAESKKVFYRAYLQGHRLLPVPCIPRPYQIEKGDGPPHEAQPQAHPASLRYWRDHAGAGAEDRQLLYGPAIPL